MRDANREVRAVSVVAPNATQRSFSLLGLEGAVSAETAVYFVQSTHGGPIKIGFSNNVTARLRDLQHGSPLPLVVLATTPGARTEEAALHDRYRYSRMHGEWFAPSDDLLDHIRSLGGLPLGELCGPPTSTPRPFRPRSVPQPGHQHFALSDRRRFVATKRQFEILVFIAKCVATHDAPPTLREIGRAFGIASTNGVVDHLRAMERRHLIERPARSEDVALRTIALTDRAWQAVLNGRTREEFAAQEAA